METKSGNDCLALAFAEFLAKLIESKMDDVVMMNFFGSNFAA
jgi:hypothetical protein